MNVLSLFSGIGGLDLGLERAGATIVGQVELDPFCQRVLAEHWPKVPRHADVRTCIDWWCAEPRPAVDCIAGGFPCQPVSDAGRRLAQADSRWLWPAMFTVICAVRPVWVIAENVPGLLRRGLSDVVSDLESEGYQIRTGTITACAMGAPHTRERLFIIAHAQGKRWCSRGPDTGSSRPTNAEQQDRCGLTGATWWAVEPSVGRVAYGVPQRVDRCRALGNAVVPQVAEYIGRLFI